MAAPHYRFTTEQIEALRKNPNVYSADQHKLCFTAEFKERFWLMYNVEHLTTREILSKNGIDPEMLGISRPRGIAQAIKKEYERYGSFSSTSRKSGSATVTLLPEQEIQRLRAELEYLKQERDFLKKILSAGKGGKSV